MTVNEEKISAKPSILFSGNLILAVWLGLAAVGCYLVSPLVGVGFFLFSSFSVFIIVRRLLCNSCYYCKSCTRGFAKLAFLFLGANRIPGLSRGSIFGMSIFLYMILTAVPLWLLIDSVFQEFSLLKVSVLGLIVLISIYGVVGRLGKSK